MQDLCEYFMQRAKAEAFNIQVPGNVVIRHEKSFQGVITSLEESGVDTSSITVFEFYSRIEHFEKRYQKLKRNGSHQ